MNLNIRQNAGLNINADITDKSRSVRIVCDLFGAQMIYRPNDVSLGEGNYFCY